MGTSLPKEGASNSLLFFFFGKDILALILRVLSVFQEWIVGLAKEGGREATTSGFLS